MPSDVKVSSPIPKVQDDIRYLDTFGVLILTEFVVQIEQLWMRSMLQQLGLVGRIMASLGYGNIIMQTTMERL